jgi:hypothetical protein
MFGDVGSMRALRHLDVKQIFLPPATTIDPASDLTYIGLRLPSNAAFAANFLSSLGFVLDPKWEAILVSRSQEIWVTGKSNSPWRPMIPHDGTFPPKIDGIWFTKLSNATYTAPAIGNMQGLNIPTVFLPDIDHL